MFIGHYAAALAARTVEPRVPLWSYVAACQLVDIGWSGLIMTGAERFSVDPDLPGSPLVLYHMPFTHSLPGALAWSLAGALAVRWLLRVPWRGAILVGLVVLSHWLLDLLVHRPDLELWVGGDRVGLGLWNHPLPEATLEMGLLAAAGAAWAWSRARAGLSAWPAVGFLLALTGIQIASQATPAASDPVAMGGMALGLYLAITGLAWLVERRAPPAAS